jgi:hypothetical protein
MRYVILVKASRESESGEMPSTEQLAEMGQFNEEMVNAGVMLGGEGLHASAEGARIRFDGGKRTVIDGPFDDPESLVAGFWIVQVKSRQEVLDWAKRIPFRDGEVEIRRIFESEDFGEALTPELREQEDRLRRKEEQAKGAKR